MITTYTKLDMREEEIKAKVNDLLRDVKRCDGATPFACEKVCGGEVVGYRVIATIGGGQC